MNIPGWVEVAIIGALVVLLVADVWFVGRRPHEPSMRESALGVAFYVGLAVLFGLGILWWAGGRYAGEFYAGWLTEYSLSVDNLFVFVIIMARFAVPRQYQQKVLLIGIVLALVLRGIFIVLGAAAIERFVWVFFIFGGFLIYTAWKLAFHSDEEDNFEENALIRWSRRALPMSESYDGAKVRTVVDGKRLFTPMIVVMIAIGTTDLLFALDSIPAIFGLTKEPFLVFTANVFALMGLRQLYFLLDGLLDRLVYLSLGLSIVLGFIGVKLIFEALAENSLPFVNGGEHVTWAPHIPIWLSLSVIIGTLVVTAVASLLKTRNEVRAAAGEA
ncbi:MAG: integral rane protein TerC family [Mycobacterium sp.]|nr:integral rane protein TerC family [Mycobacterium sp.]